MQEHYGEQQKKREKGCSICGNRWVVTCTKCRNNAKQRQNCNRCGGSGTHACLKCVGLEG